MAAATYNNVVNDIVDAYFTDFPIFSLTNTFDRTINELWRAQLLSVNDSRFHAGELVKIVLAFLMVTLVEHGRLLDITRYLGESSRMHNSLCDIVNFPNYCAKLGRSEDYAKWTHLILYLISILRSEKMVDFSQPRKKPYPLMISGVSSTFISNIILLLYAFLFVRLILSQANVPGTSVRYGIESCMFASMLSFYYDYMRFTKGVTKVANANKWDTLCEQVRTTYLAEGRFFIQLRLKHPLASYLEQDIVNAAYGCLVPLFIDKFAPLIQDAATSGNPDAYPAMICLNNMWVNGPNIIVARWFRKAINNKITRGLVSSVKTVGDVAGWTYKRIVAEPLTNIHQAYILGKNVYDKIHSDRWPIPTGAAAVVCSLVTFTLGTGFYTLATEASRVKSTTMAALVFAWHWSDVNPQRPPVDMQFERPDRPGYIRLDRAPDGKFDVMAKISPLPGIPMPQDAPFRYIQRGGASMTHRRKNTEDMEIIGEALKKRYLKTELSHEMQAYIRKRLAVKTKMTGGSSWNMSGGQSDFPPAPRLPDEEPLPPGWTSVIIDEAEIPNFIRIAEDGDTLQLALVSTPLEKEAQENAEFVTDVVEPAKDVMEEEGKENVLPEAIPLSEEPKMLALVTKPPMHVVAVPVDPIITLPTISEDKRKEILAVTMMPPKNQVALVIQQDIAGGVEPILSKEINELAMNVSAPHPYNGAPPSTRVQSRQWSSYKTLPARRRSRRRSSSRKRFYRRRRSTSSRRRKSHSRRRYSSRKRH